MANYLWAHCSDLMFVLADLLHPVSRPTVERFHNGAVRYSCICQCYKSGLCDALSRLPTRTIMLPWVILLIKCELAASSSLCNSWIRFLPLWNTGLNRRQKRTRGISVEQVNPNGHALSHSPLMTNPIEHII